jgi:hypothetical protein
MRRSARILLPYALLGCRQAAAGQKLGTCAAGITASSSATTLANGTRQLTSSALHRSAVLPRLLDTLSDTYQQSTQRMDGLLEQMTAELDKVCFEHTVESTVLLSLQLLAAVSVLSCNISLCRRNSSHVLTIFTYMPSTAQHRYPCTQLPVPYKRLQTCMPGIHIQCIDPH